MRDAFPSLVRTPSGRELLLVAPRREDIAIADIARALSRICRWNGAVSEWYSVAQHSVLVSQQCSVGALFGLLHDAAEAYLGDVSRPLKALPSMAGYRALEEMWQRVIFHRFGLKGDVPTEVWLADDWVLAWERRDLIDGTSTLNTLPETRLRGLRPRDAEEAFLERFEELTHGQ